MDETSRSTCDASNKDPAKFPYTKTTGIAGTSMSKKRGETKMVDFARAVADVVEYDRIAATVQNDVMRELASALSMPESILGTNESTSYSSHRADRDVAISKQPRARSRTFIAKPCTLCTALRGQDTNFTRVYASRGNVRYCKCHYCNNTWKDSDS